MRPAARPPAGRQVACRPPGGTSRSPVAHPRAALQERRLLIGVLDAVAEALQEGPLQLGGALAVVAQLVDGAVDEDVVPLLVRVPELPLEVLVAQVGPRNAVTHDRDLPGR